MTEIRLAKKRDAEFWFSLDGHITHEAFERKLILGECYIALADGEPVGILRYSLFWDNKPFCNLIYIAEPYRGHGIGTALMDRWESDMLLLGYDSVMTSTQANEEAQHFYRHLGYRDIGGFVLPDEPLELVFYKNIRN